MNSCVSWTHICRPLYRFGGPSKGCFFQLKGELTTTVWLRCLTFSVSRSLRVRKPRISAPIRQNALCCSGVRTWRTQWWGKTLVLLGTHTVFAFDEYTPDSTSHAVYRRPTKTPTEKQGTGQREGTPWTLQDWGNLERETDSFCPYLRWCKWSHLHNYGLWRIVLWINRVNI